ncbi:dihydrolipoyllysine-residue acetyltransferase [Solimonas sp. K1W22B-7]|uniref:dihydrolipoyllysine-residue acetyltransferase n=1 Tax=Solimonas sp. K1W22B-7 TaxID=2303331 RepID=UPI000E334987|nr:dihydrolipoyllysine-residue acetyltransferase [Solimonas sp. K1W22B-7]AXQ31554.1 dihydrolipoyllysine-residue acetyltransferase [Solimonas sp. K1W22B-7]
MANIDVKVPDIGDSHDVPVIELLVKDGDTVTKDQPLLVLESDKATMEVPAPAAGVVRALQVKLGDKLNAGSAICQLESEGAAAAPKPAPKAAAIPEKKIAAEAAPTRKAEAPAAAPQGGGSVEVRIPDLGDSHDVPVIELLVKDGDAVEKDQPLLVLESDKATMEVPAPAAGTVRALKVKLGDKLSKGDVVCSLEGAAGVAPATKTEPVPATAGVAVHGATSAPQSTPAQPSMAGRTAGITAIQGSDPSSAVPYAGPATRQFARKLGVDLAKVRGSGPRGRIVIEDVQGFVKAKLSAAPTAAAAVSGGSGIPPIPAQDFSLYGEIENKPLARIRKISAAHLHRSWLNVPHVTQNDEADISELEAFRKAQGEELNLKLTLLPFIMKAVAAVMKQYPEFNSSLSADGESLVLKKYCHIGFAADTPNGLVVPVVRDVWSKGIVQLSNECGELAKKARDGKLKPDEMRGGCFSISSLGGIGGSHFTPIVNAPEVAILGVSRSQMKPVWDGKAFQPRLMCPLSLSYDHRVIDGAAAARFVVALGRLLGDMRRLAL